MKYTKELNDFEKALDLDKKQVKRLQDAISKAYGQEKWHPDGPNIDQINAMVAPYIKSQEEAFYAATVIISDVYNVLKEMYSNVVQTMKFPK
jgi:hypothetical protein